MAGADPRSNPKQDLALIPPIARSLSSGIASGSRTPNLVQTIGQSTSGICGISLLPRADVAAANAGCAGRGIDLSTLQRYLDAVRRNPHPFAGGVGRVGSPIWAGPCSSTLGRPSAQKQRRLRSGLRKGGGRSGATAG